MDIGELKRGTKLMFENKPVVIGNDNLCFVSMGETNLIMGRVIQFNDNSILYVSRVNPDIRVPTTNELSDLIWADANLEFIRPFKNI